MDACKWCGWIAHSSVDLRCIWCPACGSGSPAEIDQRTRAEKAETRLASAVCLIPDGTLCGDIQQAAETYAAERNALKTRVETAESERDALRIQLSEAKEKIARYDAYTHHGAAWREED